MKKILITTLFALFIFPSGNLLKSQSGYLETFVIVHGAWGGSWAFREVDSLLTSRGCLVYRPGLTGLGERIHLASKDIGLQTHINDVVNMILFEELDDIILVGHSYGGMVVTGVADSLAGRIKKLVYLDAFMPVDGESLFSITGGVSGGMMNMDKDGFLIPSWLSYPEKPIPSDVPHPTKTCTDALHLSGKLNKIPTEYILTVDKGKLPEQDDFASQAERAKNQGFKVHLLESDHNPQWSAPVPFSELILKIAQSGNNPLKGDLRVHDPVMIKQDNQYYIFSTGRGVSIKTSEDRIQWERTGRVFGQEDLPAWHTEDIPEQKGHLWAPDIHYRDGKYHLYYSVSAWMNFNSSIGYATNTTLNPGDPDYQWMDQGKVISYKNGGKGVNVIDPMVFVDDDGRVWLFYGSYQAGLRMAELDPETGQLLQDPPELRVITPALGEGVFIIKDSEYYYIFASRGKCCSGLESNYQIIMGRSKDLGGPYLNRDGESWQDIKYTVFLAGDRDEPGRGHNGFFHENDTTFIVYHAYSRSANGTSLLNIKPLYMGEDSWPSIEPSENLFRMKTNTQ